MSTAAVVQDRLFPCSDTLFGIDHGDDSCIVGARSPVSRPVLSVNSERTSKVTRDRKRTRSPLPKPVISTDSPPRKFGSAEESNLTIRFFVSPDPI